MIVLFGDTAFVPPATTASEQRLPMEKQLATAAKSRPPAQHGSIEVRPVRELQVAPG